MLFVIFLLVTGTLTVNGDLGVMYARRTSAEWDTHYCISYNPGFHELPSSMTNAKSHKMLDLSTKLGCEEDDYKGVAINKNMVVVVARGNCSFSEKAFLAQKFGMAAVVIVVDSLILPGANQTSDFDIINITVASIKDTNFDAVKNLGKDIDVLLFSPNLHDDFDPCIVVIFLIAMLCITVGGYWSGVSLQSIQKKKSAKKPKYVKSVNKDGEEESDDEEEDFEISLPYILILVFLICVMLVLLFFFYDYLVYVVITMFCIAGATGLYSCCLPLWNFIPWHTRIPSNKIPCFSSRPQIKDLILLAICCGFGAFWGVVRNASYAWVLQDILGAAFCINMLKTIRLPNLKVCAVLLLLLFVYDIFFVFITPLFTKTGESVMVKVATGGSSKTGEQLPMVFKVPRLSKSPLSVCDLPYSLLGFGDIIVPGLLVSYNHGFDIRVQSKRIYFISTLIAYAVGLVATFGALYIMDSGQPALLYLVPCTLLTTFVIGCCRGECKLLWNGFSKCPKKDDDVNPVKTTPPNSSSSLAVEGEDNLSNSDSEQQTLIPK